MPKKLNTKPDTKPKAANTKKKTFLQKLNAKSGIEVIPVSDAIPNENTFYTDTGSYTFNAIISGSIFGGIPSDTIVGLAGEQGTGKTYVCLESAKHFLDAHPNGVVEYYETEGAVKLHMIVARQIPEDRISLIRVDSVEQFQYMLANRIKGYNEMAEDEREPMFFVLDSLGNISSEMELKQSTIAVDKKKKDMSRAREIKGVFRVLALKLARANLPLIVTNHVYADMMKKTKPGTPPAKRMGGGEGLYYAASTIIFLAKSPDYDEVTKTYRGSILTATLFKSRNTLEHLKIKTRLDFRTGMDRYFGLFDVAKQFGIAKNESNGFRMGEKFFHLKNVNEHPEEYFTEDVLKAIDEMVQKAFCYGKGVPMELIDQDVDDDGTEFEIDQEEAAPAPEPLDDTEAVKEALTKKKSPKK
jgi:RecA/RadA recombinase